MHLIVHFYIFLYRYLGYKHSIPMDIKKKKLSFTKQKIYELIDLKNIIKGNNSILIKNLDFFEKTKTYFIFNDKKVRVLKIKDKDIKIKNPFKIRKKKQHQKFNLSLFPIITIRSFPQTK
ncbi:hypothetical protein [Blattabacterium punctulatus]|uniref:hypothetical protein n=1 Tax=Blattabacterium punctulatus TaxID=164514 RepID=UPI001F3DBD87|nr:hypothetical protein [Blattabacterium punctulatus]